MQCYVCGKEIYDGEYTAYVEDGACGSEVFLCRECFHFATTTCSNCGRVVVEGEECCEGD